MTAAPPLAIAERSYTLVTTYLSPGVTYYHHTLKPAFFAACNAGMWCKEGDEHYREGAVFIRAIYCLWENGQIEMSETVIDGEKVDFFKAVITARHDIKMPIQGWLEVCP